VSGSFVCHARRTKHLKRGQELNELSSLALYPNTLENLLINDACEKDAAGSLDLLTQIASHRMLVRIGVRPTAQQKRPGACVRQTIHRDFRSFL
jgi:hypothetical protein